MAGMRPRRKWEGLVGDERDAAAAPPHTPCPGELLVKQLAAKQVSTTTSLTEQLAITQEFVSAHDTVSQQSPRSAEELCRASGLTRHQLEDNLSMKPDSDMSRLYRFALGNCKPTRPPNLLQQLPDHPINNLKDIEKAMMEGLGSKPRRRKHRTRRKKVRTEVGCVTRPASVTEAREDIAGIEACAPSTTSLWDIEGPSLGDSAQKFNSLCPTDS